LCRYRSLALAFLQKDQAYVAAEKKRIQEEQALQKSEQKGWFSSLSNLKSWISSSQDDISLELTNDVWRELYANVSEETVDESKKDVPRVTINLRSHFWCEILTRSLRMQEYVKLKAFSVLNKGSLELRSSDGSQCITKGSFHRFQIYFHSREGSFTFGVDIESVDVEDYHTPNSKYPRLIEAISDSDNKSAIKSSSSAILTSPYFFSLAFENNPIDNFANYKLKLAMKPLNIVLSRPYLDRIITFFVKPLSKQQSKDLGQAAYNRLDELRRLTQSQWKLALQNRKVLDLHVNIYAPNIIIPEDFGNEKCSKLVLVLGKMKLRFGRVDFTHSLTFILLLLGVI